MVTAYVKILPQQTHLFPTNCIIGLKADTHFRCKLQSLHKYTILLKSNLNYNTSEILELHKNALSRHH
jgi:hypothetical protein